MDSTARGQKLAARSRLANGRSPNMWQIEFTDQVTWCRNAIRTSPAQKNAVTTPHHDQLSRPPSAAGSARLSVIHSQK